MTFTQKACSNPVATTKKYFTRIPNGGFNRAFASHKHEPDEFYDLVQMRPESGKLVQFPQVVQKQALSLLSGESATTQVRYLGLVRSSTTQLRYLVVNETNARIVDPASLGTQTKLLTVLQTAVPNNTTSQGQCLLYGINPYDFTGSGDSISVKITATNKLQWRRNAGSWSADLTVDAVVNLGANGLKVAFLADTNYTGFNIGDTWVWTASNTVPYSGAVTSTVNFPYDSTTYKTDVYLGGIGRNVMRVRDGFITSVGYNRMYGKYVEVYQNHLVVAHAAMGQYHAVSGVSDPYTDADTPFTLAWSHLNDPDQFFATADNEADTYVVPYNSYPDMTNFGVTGLAKMGTSLYIYLPDSIYKMDYVGLPNVMQTLPAWENVGSMFPSGLVNTKRGHYFIGRDNFYFFSGLQPQVIGEPVREKFFSEVVPMLDGYFEKTYGYYDSYRQEVVWTYWTKVGSSYQCKQVVYMEKYNRWTFRNMPSKDSSSNDLLCMCDMYNSPGQALYGGKDYLYVDYKSGEAGTAQNDLVGGTFTQPLAETHDLYYDDIYVQKESDALYIDAGWTSGVSGLQASVSMRPYLSSSVSFTNANALWTQSVAEGRIGFPRDGVSPTKGRVIRLRFTFSGTSPVGCVLNGWGDQIWSRGGER